MTTSAQFGRAVPPQRRRHVQWNNLVLGPASLLPFKAEWRTLADALPAGAVLFIELPSERSQAAMQAVVAQFRAAGRQVKTMTSVDRLLGADPDARVESTASLRA